MRTISRLLLLVSARALVAFAAFLIGLGVSLRRGIEALHDRTRALIERIEELDQEDA